LDHQYSGFENVRWWLRLGIDIERIKPGHPQQNGRHQRMHLTPKKEATKPPAKYFLQQQAKFDRFIACFNNERPHQALQTKYSAELYLPSTRPYNGLQELSYPLHDRTVMVTNCGRNCIGKRKVNLSVRRSKYRQQGDRGENLVSQLHALRFRVLRSPVRAHRMRRKPPSGLKCFWSQWIVETLASNT
jgi:hypothetical protein